ncbi:MULTISPECIES: Imm32 family immunity protein [unclassified Streptomyces]|uniref:Imm32 family immunity protein n=1 Tax=unclassified Streptomyces TaxID=2593676 RepID=UPI002E376B25|nr:MULTISPECIES: hypothetical protein [unclassified Streptomyces]
MDEPRIKVQSSKGEALITANAEGLRALAARLLELADPDLRNGYHLHLDANVDLEAGSADLVLERDDAL